jgi:uncharacterized RDD family membrane protein YckC
MATCPSCGTEYAPPAAFCSHCGAVLDKPDTGATVAGGSTQPQPGPSSAGPTTTTYAAEPKFGDAGIYIVRRFLALVVDVAGVGLLIAIGLLEFFERVKTGIQPQTPDGFRTFAVIVAALLFIYYWLFEAIFGTTLGKLLFGLEVRHSDGARIGFLAAFVRNLIRIVDLAIVGFLLAAVTPRRRRLGDMIAGTIVPSHRMGALAPLVAIVVLGGIGYLAYGYGGAMRHARDLYNSAQQYGPAMLQGATPAPTATAPAAPSVEASSTATVPSTSSTAAPATASPAATVTP